MLGYAMIYYIPGLSRRDPGFDLLLLICIIALLIAVYLIYYILYSRGAIPIFVGRRLPADPSELYNVMRTYYNIT